MDLHEEVKIYVKETYNDSPSANQQEKRLHEIVDILEQNGAIQPTEADFENILKPAIASKGRKQGQSANEKTIRDRLSLARKFYNWIQKKGDFQMNESKIENEQQQKEQVVYPEVEDNQQEVMNVDAYEAEATRKAGKPVTNGRSKKISLYVTPETFNRLDDLKKYDEVDLQDLLNEAIEVYFKTREDDMKFLREQEEARRARKARKTQNALND